MARIISQVLLTKEVHKNQTNQLLNNSKSIPDVAGITEGVKYSFQSATIKVDVYDRIPFNIWNTHREDSDIFLSKDYLSSVEQHPPESVKPYYLIFYQDAELIGMLNCQLITLNVGKSINFRLQERKNKLERWLLSWVEKGLNFVRPRMLIVGNVLLTGQYAYSFKQGVQLDHSIFASMDAILHQLSRKLTQDGDRVDLVFYKDLGESDQAHIDFIKNQAYSPFAFQPNMSMELDSNWKSFEDYLGAMSSKYRVRAKRAIKKAHSIERVSLDLATLEANSKRIFELYQQIALNSDFNMVFIPEDYFIDLKRKLGDRYEVWGYYQNKELIGFATTIKNGAILDAHFLGFDVQVNRATQLYLNMLYHIIEKGISIGSKKIKLSRTAMTIKSSVGARPDACSCYLKHRNPIINWMMPFLINFFEPKVEWDDRHPFKK